MAGPDGPVAARSRGPVGGGVEAEPPARAPHQERGDHGRRHHEVGLGVQLDGEHLGVDEAAHARLHLAPRQVDLGHLAQRVATGFRTAAAARGVRLDLAVPPGAVRARADPDRVAQVLANLLDNALRHTPAGGRVRVGVERADGVVLTVADSGPGFPDDVLDRVFERFSRADTARSRASGGSGLGLAVVKALVDLHGGRVEARNADTGGALVAVTLPADAP